MTTSHEGTIQDQNEPIRTDAARFLTGASSLFAMGRGRGAQSGPAFQCFALRYRQ